MAEWKTLRLYDYFFVVRDDVVSDTVAWGLMKQKIIPKNGDPSELVQLRKFRFEKEFVESHEDISKLSEEERIDGMDEDGFYKQGFELPDDEELLKWMSEKLENVASGRIE